MLAYIQGKIEEFTRDGLILDHQGMGYSLMVPSGELDKLRTGQTVKLYTYVQLLEREGTFQAFGFLSKETLALFKLLLTVSGIGPKAALGILSGLTPDTLRFAILSDDVKTISKAPGIGKKTAQKLILELKEKLDLEEAFEQKLNAGTETVTPAADTSSQEAVEALVALGYSGTEALKAVQKAVGEGFSGTEELLKAALKYL